MDHNLLTNCDIPRSDSLQLFEEIKTNCMSFLLKPLGTLTDIIHYPGLIHNSVYLIAMLRKLALN